MRPSLNAVAQAYKLLKQPTKRTLMRALEVPYCQYTGIRYWSECWNILPWDRRSDAEREAAIQVVETAEAQGISLRNAMELIH